MEDWPDQKIGNVACRCIEQHAMDVDAWKYTRPRDVHPRAVGGASLPPGELPIVSGFVADGDRLVFSTRRIFGRGDKICGVDRSMLDVRDIDFGNRKGIGGREIEAVVLAFNDGALDRLDFETGPAALAPVYA